MLRSNARQAGVRNIRPIRATPTDTKLPAGAVVDVMRQVRTDIVLNITVADRLTDAANLLESQPEVESVQDKNGVLVVKMNEGVNQYSFLASRLIESGYDLTLFKEDEINLETAFMHLTKGITS